MAAVVGLLRGMRAFGGGVGWVAGTPRVWVWAAVPVATALALVGLFGALGVHAAMLVARRVSGSGLGSGLLGVLLAIAAVLLAIIVGISLAQPLSGWALTRIVRAQERELGVVQAAEPPLLAATLGSLASAWFGLAVGVPLIALLTLAGWIFPPGAVVTLPLKAAVVGLLLAWDLLDYPLASRGLGLAARLSWCARDFGAVLGFGLTALLLFAVPGLGLVALPCGVAGAVRLVAARTQREAAEKE
jgi:CysZ protein